MLNLFRTTQVWQGYRYGLSRHDCLMTVRLYWRHIADLNLHCCVCKNGSRIPTDCDNNVSIQIGFMATLLMSAALRNITGNDSVCDNVPTASEVWVRFNITVQRARLPVVTDNPFTQNIGPSRKEEIHVAK